jgi:hypothetical protein
MGGEPEPERGKHKRRAILGRIPGAVNASSGVSKILRNVNPAVRSITVTATPGTKAGA